MTVRLSGGLRSKMLNGGATGGFKGALALGFINIYSGPQPLHPETGASGTLLGTVSVDGGGTGLTFDTAADGVIQKAAAEDWKFTGLAAGTAGWFRFYAAGADPATTDSAAVRLDGAIATSGSDLNLSNISVAVSSPNTLDIFQFTLPES